MIKSILLSLIIFVQAAGAAGNVTPSITRFDCPAMLAGSDEVIGEGDPLSVTKERFRGKDVNFETALGWVAAILDGKDRKDFLWVMRDLLDSKDPAKKAMIIRRRETLAEQRARPEIYINFITREFDVDGDSLDFLFETIRRAFSLTLGDAAQWTQSSSKERPNVSEQFQWRAMYVLYFQYKLYCRLLTLAGIDDWEVKEGSYMITREYDLPVPGKNPLRFIHPNERDRILFDQIGLRFTVFQFLRDFEKSRGLERQKLINDAEKQKKTIDPFVLKEFDESTDIQLKKAAGAAVQSFVNQLDVYYSSNPGILRRYGGYTLVGVLTLALGVYTLPMHLLVPDLPTLAQRWNVPPQQPPAIGPGFPKSHAAVEQVLHDLEKQGAIDHNSTAQEIARKGLEDLRRLESQP